MFKRFQNIVITDDSAPIDRRGNFIPMTNPFFMVRLA
jgi:hypothetical protein